MTNFSLSDLQKQSKKFGLSETSVRKKMKTDTKDQEILDKVCIDMKEKFNLDVKVREADSSLINDKYYAIGLSRNSKTGLFCFGGKFSRNLVCPEKIKMNDEWIDFQQFAQDKKSNNKEMSMNSGFIKIVDKELETFDMGPEEYLWRLTKWPTLSKTGSKVVYSLRQGLNPNNMSNDLYKFVTSQIDEIEESHLKQYFRELINDMDTYNKFNFLGFCMLCEAMFEHYS